MLEESDKLQPIITLPRHKTLTDETKTAIFEAIQQGKFPPGSQLPPELEFMGSLKVSRTTIREALRVLEDQGVIYRRRGLGTYVSERPIVKDLSENFGITEMISQAGFTPGAAQEEVRTEKAAGRVAERLEVAEGTPILVLDRVRTANGAPVVWSLDMVPLVVFQDRTPLVSEFETQSLYDYLEKQHNIRIAQGLAKIRPGSATREIAAKLQIRQHDLLLIITQVDYSDDHRPVIYSIEHHLPDKFSFVINRKGPHR